MKITDVKVETIRIPMKKPFRIAFAVQDHSLNVLVKISTDEGLWGIGEAAPFEPVTGESAATVLEALKLFRTGLIGMDPLDVEGIHRMMDRLLSGNTSAKAAVDIALYDIKGKLMGQPLYKVLGGSCTRPSGPGAGAGWPCKSKLAGASSGERTTSVAELNHRLRRARRRRGRRPSPGWRRPLS